MSVSLSFEPGNAVERAFNDDESEKQKIAYGGGAGHSSSEAEAMWPQVLEHKWYLSERAGRDVGLKAAALDYFKNVRGVRKQDELRGMQPPSQPCKRPLGYW